MGQLRGISFDSADSPAGVLGRLDRAMDGLELGTLAPRMLPERAEDDVALIVGGLTPQDRPA